MALDCDLNCQSKISVVRIWVQRMPPDVQVMQWTQRVSGEKQLTVKVFCVNQECEKGPASISGTSEAPQSWRGVGTVRND